MNGLGTRARSRRSEKLSRALDILREAEDTRTGVRERFLTPLIGGARTVGVLATPAGERRSTGWVVCHSFGMEQVHLQTHEVPTARALAALGYPVLRFHGQGYGDSEGSAFDITLSSHLRDVTDAVEVLVSETRVENVGLLGGRLGATVAAMAGAQLDAASLVLWEPVVDGSSYIHTLVRLALTLGLMHRQGSGAPPDLEHQIEEDGFIDVQGLPLTRNAFNEIRGLDLTTRVEGFRGDSMVVRISRDPRSAADLERLVPALQNAGGTCATVSLGTERPNVFGLEPRFKPWGRSGKIDTQRDLGRALVSATTAWVTEADQASSGS